MFREEYSPTLFVPSKRESKHKTLEGDNVEPIQPGSVRESFTYKKYSEVENFQIYGNDRYVCQYISDKYPEDEIKFDMTKIKLTTIDIEVSSEEGFDVESASEEILAITLQDYATKQIITWGIKPFNNTSQTLVVEVVQSMLCYLTLLNGGSKYSRSYYWLELSTV